MNTHRLPTTRYGWRLPIRALAVLLLTLAGLTNTLYAQATRVTFVVQQPLDDMEEYVVGGGVDWNSSDIEMTSEGGGEQIMGFRFTNVTIPAGAIITGAWVQFTADEANSEATTLTLRGEAADNSAQFQDASFTVSSRTRTTASVNWNVPAWTVLQQKGDPQKSSDIKSVIQEIVNRSGWASGNALSVIINGTGKRVAESQEGATAGTPGHDASQAANLIVDYVIPTEFSKRIAASSDDAEQNLSTNAMDLTSSDLELTEDAANQYIGMRWTNVSIPAGAIVTSAYIQFAADELFPNPTSLTIRGFAADNVSTFTASSNDIGGRAVTTATASWAPVEWTILQEQDSKQRSTDLTAVVQEIINRGGWASGNALGLRIDGSGKRVAEAFDGSAPEAPMLVIKYYTTAAPDVPWGTFPVTMNSMWRFSDNGANLGTAWTSPNYNDSSWKAGKPQLGYGDGDEATVIGFGPNANAKYITSYFRHTFNVTNLASMDSVVFNLVRDDGAIVYLNGTEIYRSNMPSGAVTYTTVASSAVGSTDESRQWRFSLPKSVLVLGKNVLTVEIHQDAGTSSDLSFALTAEGLKNDVNLITTPTAWRYLDNGFYPGSNWSSSSYNDAAWKSGNGPFGYGNGYETTIVNYGPNPAFKYITTYFRKTVNIADTAGFGSLELKLKADDGAVIWINGVEAFRFNMPGGMVDQLTLANSFIEGPNENVWNTFYINRSLLKPGTNVIGIEIHQNSSTSTDLAFDAQLKLLGTVNALSSSASIQTCPPNSSSAIGCFTSVHPSSKNQILNIPTATHTWQVIAKSLSDKYTGTNTSMPNGNDFTGFIPYSYGGGEPSSTRGWLSINHENTPGSVSMLTMNLDPLTMTWKVDTIKNVSFADVVTTTRNCSGGVTPWGTVITSEETYNNGDANADGYTDVGWQVEIDPVTAKVRDFDGDGKGDKLWAIGRMNHENICVLRDSVTIYQGEDGGTGGFYKFVATQKGNLSNGTLYVLKQDAPGSTNGTWIVVPNTTKTERNTTANLAGALGGTRFGGVEDAEVGPDGMIYFTEKGLGDIWRFKDNGGTVSNLEKYVSNTSFSIVTDRGSASVPWNTGIDNLAFDGEGNLWGLQDGGSDHIWVVRAGHTMANPKVELFATTPEGCEPTGLTFSPDFKYGFISMQNPSNANTAVQLDATGRQHVWNASTTLVFARREHLGPEAKIPAVELGSDIYRCVGQSVTLKFANVDAQNIWTVRDANGAVQVAGYDSILTIRETGVVYLTSIGNNGLTKTDSVKVTFNELPKVNLGPDLVICPGDTVILNAGSFESYAWEDFRTKSPIRTITRPGMYWVTVTSPGGCVASDTVIVKAEPGSTPNLGTDRAICQGSQAILSPGGGFAKYLWNTGDTTATISVGTAGKYWVRTTNNRGCEVMDSVFVTLLPRPNLGPDVRVCDGERVTLNAGPGYSSYLWNIGGTSQTLLAAKAGKYWVTVTDDEGCKQTDTIEVITMPLPVVHLGRDTTLEEGKSLTLDAGQASGYEWNTGARSRTITVSQSGTYTVKVTSGNGCENTGEISVQFVQPSSVNNIYSNEMYNVTLYPNPFDRDLQITLDLKKPADYLMEIYDVTGRKVSTVGSGSGIIGKQEFTVDAKSLDARDAFYLLKLTVNGKQTSYKLIRKK